MSKYSIVILKKKSQTSSRIYWLFSSQAGIHTGNPAQSICLEYMAGMYTDIATTIRLRRCWRLTLSSIMHGIFIRSSHDHFTNSIESGRLDLGAQNYGTFWRNVKSSVMRHRQLNCHWLACLQINHLPLLCIDIASPIHLNFNILFLSPSITELFNDTTATYFNLMFRTLYTWNTIVCNREMERVRSYCRMVEWEEFERLVLQQGSSINQWASVWHTDRCLTGPRHSWHFPSTSEHGGLSHWLVVCPKSGTF